MDSSNVPDTSAPSAFNLNGAPHKIADSSSFSLADGKASAPVELPKAPIGKPETVVTARPGVLPKGGGEKALVTYVEDGDTASLKRGDGSSVNCRIDKIDAPEVAHPKVGKPAQAFGEESKKVLQDMIANKEVNLRIVKDVDKYGRAVCQIEVEGNNIDIEMIKRGAAWLNRTYVNDPALSAAEDKARTNKTGLFANPNAQIPWQFRRDNPARQ